MGSIIHDRALVASATLSDRYITDRFLPDKAIDLMDEACAMIRTEIDSMPSELDEVTRKVMQLEIEEAALAKESDEAHKERLINLQKELAEYRDQANTMRAKWQLWKRKKFKKYKKNVNYLEKSRRELEKAENEYDLNKAAELRHGKIAALEKELQQMEAEVNGKQGERLLREEVTEDEISDCCSHVGQEFRLLSLLRGNGKNFFVLKAFA